MWNIDEITRQLLDFIFPPHCIHCKQIGYILCPSCLALVQPLSPPLCHTCCAPLVNGSFCRRCYFYPLQLNGLRVCGNYEEPLRSYIHKFKYRGKKSLAEPLARLLVHTYTTYAMQADCIVPVPLHRQREQERGYNQAQLLARVCAASLNLPMDTTLLQRTRSTQTQARLSLQDRQQNVSNAFHCDPVHTTPMVANRRIVIIDDVCTTGSTLAACAAPLFMAGAREVWGLVLARPKEQVSRLNGQL